MNDRVQIIAKILDRHMIHPGHPFLDKRTKFAQRIAAKGYTEQRFGALADFAMAYLGTRSGVRNPAALFYKIIQEKLDSIPGDKTELDDLESRIPGSAVSPGESIRDDNMRKLDRERDKEEDAFKMARISREIHSFVNGDRKSLEDVAKMYNLTPDEARALLKQGEEILAEHPFRKPVEVSDGE